MSEATKVNNLRKAQRTFKQEDFEYYFQNLANEAANVFAGEKAWQDLVQIHKEASLGDAFEKEDIIFRLPKDELERDIVIFSDLHLGHSSSNLQDVRQMEELIPKGAILLINGDGFEALCDAGRKRAFWDKRELKAICQKKGARLICLAGNHDPDISRYRAALIGEREEILISHGDSLPEVPTPWSKKYLENEKALRELALESHLLASKKGLHAKLEQARAWAKLLPPLKREQGFLNSMLQALSLAASPTCVSRIVNNLMQIKNNADKFLQKFAPTTKLFCIGHFHRAGVWHINGRTIVNTGCAFPILKQMAATIKYGQKKVVLRKIKGGRNKKFYYSRQLKVIDF